MRETTLKHTSLEGVVRETLAERTYRLKNITSSRGSIVAAAGVLTLGVALAAIGLAPVWTIAILAVGIAAGLAIVPVISDAVVTASFRREAAPIVDDALAELLQNAARLEQYLSSIDRRAGAMLSTRSDISSNQYVSLCLIFDALHFEIREIERLSYRSNAKHLLAALEKLRKPLLLRDAQWVSSGLPPQGIPRLVLPSLLMDTVRRLELQVSEWEAEQASSARVTNSQGIIYMMPHKAAHAG